MAMRHQKSIVLSGALTACDDVFYALFGLRLLYIAWRSDSKASQKKEMEEVCFNF
ncbi:putative Gdt1 family protein [Helianthus anomalus]